MAANLNTPAPPTSPPLPDSSAGSNTFSYFFLTPLFGVDFEISSVTNVKSTTVTNPAGDQEARGMTSSSGRSYLSRLPARCRLFS
ncbi:hypothetical protein E2C01_010392 [Portunus trituberculatus]|uniref:Uncharacterized protein n=1 Tax=Portunus trituberculatus TaxID=210409 RepID=A0A5B7D8J7_PORTR|nr:hypothetical protein [Portunus trituberculatus]